MSDKKDDFYDNYDDKSGKGILMVGGVYQVYYF